MHPRWSVTCGHLTLLESCRSIMGIHSDANWCEVQIQFTASHFRAEQVDSSTVTFSMFWHIACVPYDIMRSPLWTVSFLSNSLCCDLHTRVLGPSHSIAKASTEIVIRAGCQALEEDLRNLGGATPAMRCSIPNVQEHLDYPVTTRTTHDETVPVAPCSSTSVMKTEPTFKMQQRN